METGLGGKKNFEFKPGKLRLDLPTASLQKSKTSLTRTHSTGAVECNNYFSGEG